MRKNTPLQVEVLHSQSYISRSAEGVDAKFAEMNKSECVFLNLLYIRV